MVVPNRLNLIFFFVLPFIAARPFFRDRIPNGYRLTNWPGVGHINFGGSGPLNPFGIDFAENGHRWTKTLCELDSDGDGKSNGLELGDPYCIWKIGDQPQRTINITHPGFADDRIGPSDLNPTCTNKPEDPSEFKLEFKFENYTLPKALTHYACSKVKLPDLEQYHIVKLAVIVGNSKILHHQVLQLCTTEPKIADGAIISCENFQSDCGTVVWAWVPGISEVCLPSEAGFLIGKNTYKYALLQMHYNNPDLLEGENDSSGVKITLTPNLRNYSAGILSLSTDLAAIKIPPEAQEFSVVGSCPSICTARWPQSLTVFSTQVHAHRRGRKIWTEWYRKGKYIRDIARNDHYDYNSQKPDQDFAPFQLLPGDSFKTTCTYNSIGINITTQGGLGTDDEMCAGIVFYYPKLQGEWWSCLLMNASWRDGRPTAMCNGYMDLDTGRLLPPCDWNVDWVRYRNEALNVILPHCEMEPECSPVCRELMFQWINNNTCIERFGFRKMLSSGCPTEVKEKCNRFREVFESCDGLCAIGLDDIHCKDGNIRGKCVAFECVYNVSDLTESYVGVIIGLALVCSGVALGVVLFVITSYYV